MNKILTLFKRNYDVDHLVRNEVVPGTEWVQLGEGVATRKYDGSCCCIDEHGLFLKRREVKPGKKAPSNFIQISEDINTGKCVGWVPVDFDLKEDRWHREAYDNHQGPLATGTYELVGPKVQNNPEDYDNHTLVAHSNTERYTDCPTTFGALKVWLNGKDVEGVVWHHPDGRMAKIKKRDFGLLRAIG